MVVAVLDDGKEPSKNLAQNLNLPLLSDPEAYYLCFEDQQWVVRDPRQGNQFSIRLDFQKEFEKLRSQKISVKKDLLSRAVGFKGENNYWIVDGTLGAAKDAVHLIQLGAHVFGVEQHPVTHTLLKSALENWPEGEAKLQLHFGDTLQVLDQDLAAEVLYLDPMFENIGQKSAPKKTLAFIRELDTAAVNVPQVIEKAFDVGMKRVVVKRPLKASQLYDRPSSVLRGKLIRYDVYTR